MRDIGKNIKDLRIAKNLTQDQLAEKLFVTRQTVSNYENGKSRPDIDMIIRISEVLESDVDSVLYGVKDDGRKSEYIKLAVGAVLTVSLIALTAYLGPLTMQIQSKYYIASFKFFSGFTLTPLKWMLIGWTVMQLASIAFKTRIPAPKWTKYVRRILLAALVFYYAMAILWISPIVVSDIVYLLEKTKNIHATYQSNLPETFSAIAGFFVDNLLMRLVWKYDLRIPVFLSFGIVLWLCGFPQSKKQKNTNDNTAVK